MVLTLFVLYAARIAAAAKLAAERARATQKAKKTEVSIQTAVYVNLSNTLLLVYRQNRKLRLRH